ncbi:hypothetical protein HALA3H3_550031 [Halomonas sp. A3H3]|nr:hypothetical protein HALA3H3_550031 [Halomonas sp. A3H3]
MIDYAILSDKSRERAAYFDCLLHTLVG